MRLATEAVSAKSTVSISVSSIGLGVSGIGLERTPPCSELFVRRSNCGPHEEKRLSYVGAGDAERRLFPRRFCLPPARQQEISNRKTSRAHSQIKSIMRSSCRAPSRDVVLPIQRSNICYDDLHISSLEEKYHADKLTYCCACIMQAATLHSSPW